MPNLAEDYKKSFEKILARHIWPRHGEQVSMAISNHYVRLRGPVDAHGMSQWSIRDHSDLFLFGDELGKLDRVFSHKHGGAVYTGVSLQGMISILNQRIAYAYDDATVIRRDKYELVVYKDRIGILFEAVIALPGEITSKRISKYFCMYPVKEPVWPDPNEVNGDG